MKYPPLKPGKWVFWGGVAAHNQRPLGNWQSDHAVDLRAPPFTAVFAVETGVIRSLGFSDNGSTVWGWKFTLAADSGEEYFYAHMNRPKRLVEGQRVKAGEWLAVLGDPPYFGSHLHMGQKNGDPELTMRLPWPAKKRPQRVPFGQRKIAWRIKDRRWIVNRLKKERRRLRKLSHKDREG